MKKILQHISFTKNEIKVIIFISVILIIGASIKLYSISTSSDSNFDYSEKINEFKKISANISADINLDSGDKKDTAGLFSSEEIIKMKNMQISEDSLTVKKSKKTKKGENLQEKSINLNTAGKETLMLLPGVGESTAEKILIYRNEHGRFNSIEEIMKVKGIGKKKFEKMKIYIYVE